MSEPVESLTLRNGGCVAVDRIPRHAPERFRQALLRAVACGRRVTSQIGRAHV